MEPLLLVIGLASGAVAMAVLYAVATIEPNPIGLAVACAGGLAAWATALCGIAEETRRRRMCRAYDPMCHDLAQTASGEAYGRLLRSEVILEELLGPTHRRGQR